MPEISDLIDTLRGGEQSPTRSGGLVGDLVGVLRGDTNETPQSIVSRAAMRDARERYQNYEPSETERFASRAVPFLSPLLQTLMSHQRGRSQRAIDNGTARIGDYQAVASGERMAELAGNASYIRQATDSLSSVPAMIGETLAGGAALRSLGIGVSTAAAPVASLAEAAAPRLLSAAGLRAFGSEIAANAGRAMISPAAWGRNAAQTAVMPSMWLQPAAERAAQNGGEFYSPQNLAPSLALGFMQTATLGSLGKFGNSVPGTGLYPYLQRLGTRTLAGMVEQQGIDIMAGAVSEVLPSAWKLQTHYGVLGELLQGHGMEALQHASVQAITFAAFSALHPVMHGEEAQQRPPIPQEVLSGYRDALAAMGKEGLSAKKVGEAVNRVYDTFARELQDNPRITRPEMAQAMEAAKLPEALRPFADILSRELAVKPYGPEAMGGAAKAPSLSDLARPVAPGQAQEPPKTAPSSPPEAKGGQIPTEAAPKPPEAAPAAPQAPPPVPAKTPPEVVQTAVEMLRAVGTKPKEAKASVEKAVAASETPFADPRELVKAAIAKPEAEKAPAQQKLQELWDRAKAGELVSREEINQKAGLTKQEAHVFWGRTAEAKTLEQLGGEMGVTRQRAHQIEKSGREKMGLEKSVAEAIIKPEAEGRKQEMEAQRGLIDFAPTQEGGKKPRLYDVQEASLKALEDKIIQEGPLTPERKAFYEQEWERLHQQYDNKIHDALRAIVEKAQRMGLSPLKRALAELPELAERPKSEVRELVNEIKENLHAERLAREQGASALDIAAAQEVQPESRPAAAADQRQEAPAVGAEAAPGSPPPAERAGGQPAAEPGAAPAVTPDLGRPTRRPGELGPRQFQTGTDPEVIAKQRLTEAAARDETPLPAHPLSAQAAAQTAAQAGRDIAANVRAAQDFIAEFGGAIAPRTGRISEASADGIARLAAAPDYARRAAAHYIDHILGPNATPEQATLYGATYLELRFRHAKDAMLERAQKLIDTAANVANRAKARDMVNQAFEIRQDAENMGTFVGQEGSPLKTEADFQRVADSSEFKAIREKWKNDFALVMDEFYRKARGLMPEDATKDYTQMPGEPIHAIALQAGDPSTPSTVGMGRGNLKNPKIGQVGFTREFRGQGERYETDLRAIIEQSLTRVVPQATKAEMYRTMEREGVLKWGKPGERLEGYREIPKVDPPRGTQAATEGQTSAYVKEEAYKETRRVLGVDEPLSKIPLTDTFTWVTLRSLVEGMTHAKNIGTMFVKMGFQSIPDFVKNVYAVTMKRPETQKRTLELAQMGAMKPEGFETPGIPGIPGVAGKVMDIINMKPMSKFLDVVDTAQRLTADNTFDRLVKQGYDVKETERNRRDFINQIGQYNKKAQPWVISALRDTGIGPFATAGSNYMVQGVRNLLGNPGLQTNTAAGQVRLRAEMLGRIAAILAVVPVANYLINGRADGDENTPLGSIKLGESANGKSITFDLASFTGVPRGARVTGLLSLLEGLRSGQSSGQIANRAARDISGGVIHPMMGPAAQFVHTAVTGEDALGGSLVPKHSAGNPVMERLGAAAMNINPVVASALGGNPNKEQTGAERALGLVAPLGVRFRSDALVNQFHADLKEIEDARQAWMQEHHGMTAFPQEREYRLLHAFASPINQLGAVLKGDTQRFGYRGAPPEERQRELRQRQGELAKRAMDRLREVRGAAR